MRWSDVWKSVCVAIVPLLGVGSGCEPGVGSSCDPTEARCLNGTTQLVCQDGEYIATPCRGPGGCAVLPTVGTACDISKNKPGDICATHEEGVASCTSDHQMIVCRSGKYGFEPCRGPAGCENSRRRANCDKTLASAGDPCKDEGSTACSVKGEDLLACKGGTMQPLYRCRGEAGCEAAGKLNCDMSMAEVDDPCDPQMEGAAACTPDKREIVSCKSGKFVEDEACGPNMLCEPGASTQCVKKPGSGT
ncbi:MAG TPA: hypothetical protein VI197_33040 [Polyangiaceae bacterium]